MPIIIQAIPKFHNKKPSRHHSIKTLQYKIFNFFITNNLCPKYGFCYKKKKKERTPPAANVHRREPTSLDCTVTTTLTLTLSHIKWRSKIKLLSKSEQCGDGSDVPTTTGPDVLTTTRPNRSPSCRQPTAGHPSETHRQQSPAPTFTPARCFSRLRHTIGALF